jgi:replication factor C subunit 3/5
MLWVEKYCPLLLDKFVLHQKIANNLRKIALNGNFTHLLIFGPLGCGKKTLAMAFMRELYGPGVDKVNVEQKHFHIEIPYRSSRLEFETTVISSNYHLEIDPIESGYNDRYLVKTMIEDIGENKSFGFLQNAQNLPPYKILMLNKADHLSKNGQHSLRVSMEKYAHACRMILCCNNITRLMEPLRSRCLCIRVPAPTCEEIISVLNYICEKEQYLLLKKKTEIVLRDSNRNLRKAILALEPCKLDPDKYNEVNPLPIPKWELLVNEIAKDIIFEQTPIRLQQVRGKLYELLKSCIPPELLICKLLALLLPKISETCKHQSMKAAAYYGLRLHCSEVLFHLEAFVAKVMIIIKNSFDSVVNLKS